MNELRKAAEMALGVLLDPNTRADEVADAVKTIRQALAEPNREWVGLTDEEIHKVVSKKWWDWEDAFDIEGFSRAIEAKLKEKNA